MEGREESSIKTQDFTEFFPSEVSQQTFLCLPESAIVNARLVSRRWNSFLKDNYFWQQRYQQVFPFEAETLKNENKKEKEVVSRNWHELYKAKIENIKESIKNLEPDVQKLFWTFWWGEWKWLKDETRLYFSDLLVTDAEGRSLFNLPGFIRSEEFQVWLFEKYKDRDDELLELYGITLWHWAVLCRREGVVRDTIDKGIVAQSLKPMVGLQPEKGEAQHNYFFSPMSLLHLAVFVNHPGIVKILLTKPFDVNKPILGGNLKGFLPLQIAVKYGYLEVTQEFLGHQEVNVNYSEPFLHLYSPLCIAVKEKRMEIIELLLKDPRVSLKEKHDDHPFRTALRLGSVEIVRLFLQTMEITQGNFDKIWGNIHYFGPSILIAAKQGNVEVMELLLNHPCLDISKLYPCYQSMNSGSVSLEMKLIMIAIEGDNLDLLTFLCFHPKMAFQKFSKGEKSELLFIAGMYSSHAAIEFFLKQEIRIEDIPEEAFKSLTPDWNRGKDTAMRNFSYVKKKIEEKRQAQAEIDNLKKENTEQQSEIAKLKAEIAKLKANQKDEKESEEEEGQELKRGLGM